jgi:hypothetical protein
MIPPASDIMTLTKLPLFGLNFGVQVNPERYRPG